MIDLAPHHLETVRRILAEHMPDCEVRAFGSRATWEGQDYSDLDLAVVCEDEANGRAIERLKEAFKDSDLPIRVDILDWHAIAEDFRKAIESDCVVVQAAAETANWLETTFGSCASLIQDTISPSDCGETPYIGLEHIGEGTLSLESTSTARTVNSIKSRFRCGDILFGKLRPYFRKVVRPRFDGICSTDIWVVRPSDGVDAGYLFYLMASQQFVDTATRGSQGTRMPRAKWEFVSRSKVFLPPIQEQRAIAGVLGALDDKIELNRCMSETLEEMARAMFRSWFVDFDPVRAKVEGRTSGLPPDLDALFPAEFKKSELGEIPAGWHMESLGGLCDKPQYGYTQSATDDPIGPKFLRITDINKKPWIEWETVPYCVIGGGDLEKYRLHKGDILIARIADPGHSCIIEEEREAVFASYLIRFRPKLQIFGRFLQYWLQSGAYWNLVTGRAAGTTRISLNAKVLSEFPVLLPSSSLLEMFGKQIESLRSRVVANARESGALAAQRNELLPRLLSGKLRMGGPQQSVRATA